MPDEPMLTISMHASDWQVILMGLFELPMKTSAQTANRLQAALADAQKPAEPPAELPHVVKGGKT